MNTSINIPFQAHIVFTGKYSYDVIELGARNTHRYNITEALAEFSTRNAETFKYFIATFGQIITITNPVHYSYQEINREACRPHFNISANGKTYHIYTTKSHTRIVAITEIVATEFPF